MDPDEIARRCAKLSLYDADSPVIKVGVDLRAEGLKKLVFSLIGKVIANKEVNRDAFRSTIASLWRTKKEVETEAIGVNMFIFRFGCPWDRKRVLEGGHWSIDKNLIVLKEADGVGRISEQEFGFVPFWV
ncbi:hypothetical protein ACOSQ2_022597 [Xanthoceras sorbifolium]